MILRQVLLQLTILMLGSAINAGVTAFINAPMDAVSLRKRFMLLLLMTAFLGVGYLHAGRSVAGGE